MSWREPQQALEKQGVHPRVVEQLVSAAARNLLPGDSQGRKPPEPYRQLWYAAAVQSLADVKIETLVAKPRQATNLSLRVPSGGARLISVAVPSGYGLVLGINGTPLMQMTIYGSEGQVETERGPLRVVTLPAAVGSPVQVLVTNEGVASGLLTLSCRADQPDLPDVPARPNVKPSVRPDVTMPVPGTNRQPEPPVVPDRDAPLEPVPDSATGASMEPEPVTPPERPSIDIQLNQEESAQ